MNKEKMIDMLVSFTQGNSRDSAEQIFNIFEYNSEALFADAFFKSKSNPDLIPSMKDVIDEFSPLVVDGEKYYHFSEVTFMMAKYSAINKFSEDQYKLAASISILRNEFAKDKSGGSYYASWQANIANAFKDEWDEWVSGFGRNVSPDYIHQIANGAAKRFIESFIRTH